MASTKSMSKFNIWIKLSGSAGLSNKISLWGDDYAHFDFFLLLESRAWNRKCLRLCGGDLDSGSEVPSSLLESWGGWQVMWKTVEDSGLRYFTVFWGWYHVVVKSRSHEFNCLEVNVSWPSGRSVWASIYNVLVHPAQNYDIIYSNHDSALLILQTTIQQHPRTHKALEYLC